MHIHVFGNIPVYTRILYLSYGIHCRGRVFVTTEVADCPCNVTKVLNLINRRMYRER